MWRKQSHKDENNSVTFTDLCAPAAGDVRVSGRGKGTTDAQAYVHGQVEVKDCVGSTSSDIRVFGSDAVGADLLLVFFGDCVRSEEVHADLLVLAWRLRESTRTVFVLPKLDEQRTERTLKQVPLSVAMFLFIARRCEPWGPHHLRSPKVGGPSQWLYCHILGLPSLPIIFSRPLTPLFKV